MMTDGTKRVLAHVGFCLYVVVVIIVGLFFMKLAIGAEPNERLVTIASEKQSALDEFQRAAEIYKALKRMDEAEAKYRKLEQEEARIRATEAEKKSEVK